MGPEAEGRGEAGWPGAVEVKAPHPTDCTIHPQLDPLDREIERRIATGAANREIADAVYLSFHAVKKRVAKIRQHHRACAGRELTNRSSLVAYLARRSIGPASEEHPTGSSS